MEKNKIVAWKTDSNLNPIPNTERIFSCPSCRKVAKQIAYEEGGEARGQMVYLPNGEKWATQIIEKCKKIPK